MKNLEIRDFLDIAEKNILIDVRSPSEFVNGHISGAINIPLFSDEERKVVGTKYKQESRDTALAAAIEYIAPKTDYYLDQLNKFDDEKQVCIYCWRGGFRSGGMGHLFQSIGKEVFRLEGGYKAHRNHILQMFDNKYALLVLGGMTGSGKSELLDGIEKRGEQIIDLEGLANHKGSAFGALGEDKQPSIQQFENDLFAELSKLDITKRIWLEDESRMIGRVKIPDAFFVQIRSASVIKVEVSKIKRIERLIVDYAKFDKQDLIDSIQKISRRLGGMSTKKAITAIEQNNFYTATDIILNYYDKAYTYGLEKRDQQLIYPLKINWEKMDEDVNEILKYVINWSKK